MKRIFLLIALVSLPLRPDGLAQTPAPTLASLQAERQRMEERYKQLDAAYRDLVDVLELQRQKLDELQAEITRLRSGNAEQASHYATKADLGQLEKAIRDLNEEWNNRREADQKLIIEQIRKLKALPPEKPVDAESGGKPPKTFSKGFEYQIQPGDTLSAIIRAYNDELKLGVTLQDIKAANPNINERSLRPGTVLFIPDPR